MKNCLLPLTARGHLKCLNRHYSFYSLNAFIGRCLAADVKSLVAFLYKMYAADP